MAMVMEGEGPFRAALLVVLVLASAVAIYYRRRAAASGERISYRDEGYLFVIILRLAGVSLWSTVFAYLLIPASVGWAAMPLPASMRWAAAATALLCIWLMRWALACLGKNLTDTVVTRRDASLVTDGPYRWVRHPFYTVTALLMISVTLLTANALIGWTSLLVLGLLALRTPKEEKMLIERFGQAYREYMARTGKFLPRVSRRAHKVDTRGTS